MRSKFLVLLSTMMICLTRCFAQADMYGKGYDPTQSYTHFGADSVNIYSQNVIMHAPLLTYDQLGKLPAIQLVLSYSAPYWNVSCLDTVGDLQCYWGPVGVQGVLPKLSTDITVGAYDQDPTIADSHFWAATSPDGGLHELYGVNSDEFRALDGSGLKYVASTATLYDANGTRYMPAPSTTYSNLMEIDDVFGNRMTQSPGGYGSGGWIDSIQRSIPEPGTPSPYGDAQPGCLTSSYPTVNNGTAPYVFCYSTFNLYHPISYAVGPGIQWHTYTGTAVLLSSITLPNQTQWRFQYDLLGNLKSVTFPTGGQVNYVYGRPESEISNTAEDVDPLHPATVIQRTENPLPSDPSQAHTWKYRVTGDGPVRVTEPSGDYSDHYFTAGDNGQYIGYAYYLPFGYEAKVVYRNASGGLLKTTETQYTHLGENPNRAFTSVALQVGVFPALKTTTWPNGEVSARCIVYDVPTSQRPCGTNVATAGTGLQTWDNLSSLYLPIPLGQPQADFEYDYGTGAAGSLIRQTNTSYTALSGTNASDYFSRNILHNPYTVQIKDGTGNQASLTTYGYDDASYLAAQGTYGAATSVTRWLNTGSDVVTHTAFNADGSVSQITDPNGHPETRTYQCSGLRPYEITNALSQKLRLGYDCQTGLPTSSQDANGIAASVSTGYSYNSSWDRVSVTYPDGGSASTDYGNYAIPLAVTTTVTSTPSPSVVQVATYDGLKRPSSTSVVSGSTVTYGYDSNGRLASVSNPHAAASSATDGTVTSSFDLLDRKTYQLQQDGVSALQWSYAGSTTTFTDESNRTWKRKTDGLGRLVEVVEDPNGLNLRTTYRYNALGNLVDVDQYGASATVQINRHFTYDSLSRLLTANNPETGIVCYGTWSGSDCVNGYDPNGNLRAKTDARGVTVSYGYDALNRLISKTYSNDPSATLSSCYQYDSASNGIGKLAVQWTQKGNCPASPSGVVPTKSIISAYDALGRVKSAQQCVLAVCSSDYPGSTTYSYDLAGNLTTFGDGRGMALFTNEYDAVGRLKKLSSSWNSPTQPSALFSSPTYNPAGSFTRALYGADLLVERTYDSRLRRTGEVDSTLVP